MLRDQALFMMGETDVEGGGSQIFVSGCGSQTILHAHICFKDFYVSK